MVLLCNGDARKAQNTLSKYFINLPNSYGVRTNRKLYSYSFAQRLPDSSKKPGEPPPAPPKGGELTARLYAGLVSAAADGTVVKQRGER